MFDEWVTDKAIEVVPYEVLKNLAYYLLYQGVFKENSTTKIRPVSDVSCRGKSAPSLNDCLLKGPKLLQQIPPNNCAILGTKNWSCLRHMSKMCFPADCCSWEGMRFSQICMVEKFQGEKLKVFGLDCSELLLAPMLSRDLEKRPFKLKAI